MPTIAATVGDPTGIGPEVASKALAVYLKKNRNKKILLFADRSIFLKSELSRILPFEKKKQLEFYSLSSDKKFIRGQPSKESGAYALEKLQAALTHCKSQASALVTGPLDKYFVSLNLPGFRGHTEYLRDECQAEATTMMLKGASVTVSLVTTHIPINKVSSALDSNSIYRTIKMSAEHLKIFLKNPKIAVCGLNPHASDHGLFGNEEKEIIEPAIKKAVSSGIQAHGPFSADSLFHKSKEFDAIICMYHDQGLIPLKMKHFYDAVNITIGLPFPRVSVDHGTAFDIAGKNKASYVSYLKALEYATKWSKGISLSKRRH